MSRPLPRSSGMVAVRSPVQANECQSSRIIFVTSIAMFPASVVPCSNFRLAPLPACA